MAYWLYNILPNHSVLEIQSRTTNTVTGNILVENKKEDISPNKGDHTALCRKH